LPDAASRALFGLKPLPGGTVMGPRFLQFSRFAFLLVVAVPFTVSLPGAQGQQTNQLSKRVIGDYGYWSKYQNPPYSAAQIPYNELTHINHAGISFDSTGTLTIPQGFIEPELNNSAHANGVKVLLLIGGDFTGLESSGQLQTLVDNIAAVEEQYGYDGVDIDWEYPATLVDRNMLIALMAALRASNPNYVLSIDIPPWGGIPYAIPIVAQSLDFFNIMMYDCAGPWTAHGQLNSPIFWDPHDPAPYECQPGGSASETATYFLKQVPGEKLNMGMPFYGYYYTNIHSLFGLCPNAAFTADGECDNTVLSGNYGTSIKPRINKLGWHTLYDPIALVPYMLRDDGSDGYITYDDAFSTHYRTWYSDWQRGLGGTFMWSLDADYDGHSQDLLSAMYSAASGH
jgi:chitinase